MPTEEKEFKPDAKLSAQAYVSSMEQYKEMYKQSIDDPKTFWGNIARQFHWETHVDLDKFFTFNFDISKGPIYIKWMEGASTNICYNLLDRNVKSGLGDTIAYYW